MPDTGKERIVNLEEKSRLVDRTTSQRIEPSMLSGPARRTLDDRQFTSNLSAVVVEKSFTDALPILSFLVACHFHVTVTDTFVDAKIQMTERPPTLLITELRLAAYNGLGLVLRGKSRQPEMAAVVVSSVYDSVLQADAEAMGATFVLKPVADREFQAATLRTLFRRGDSGATPVPIRAPFERRDAERRRIRATATDDRRCAERRRDISSLFVNGAEPVRQSS